MTNAKHIHFIGIGGAGLSAIATVLLAQGYTVSGSDMQASTATARLHHLGATICIGHTANNITTPNSVVISSAVSNDNPEIVEAKSRGIPVIKRPTWLGQMMQGKRGIAIAGTHGKTTTTTMTSLILAEAGLSPTYIIGGFSSQLNTGAAAGQSDLFVLEADEYDRTFLSLQPEIAVITSLEWDHPDCYPTAADYADVFRQFAKKIRSQKHLILCGDYSGVQTLQANFPQATTYGLLDHNQWQATEVSQNQQGGSNFHIQQHGQRITTQPVSLSVPGNYNIQNALAAIIAAHLIGVPVDQASKIVSTFSGTQRRFEIKGEINGVLVIDDYAHHPTEVKATLAAARSRFGQRPIWAVFQPHTFTRTRSLLADFSQVFIDADHAIILDIFSSAREADDGSISSRDLITTISHTDVRYIGSLATATSYLRTHLTAGDVLLTLGAGDGYKVGEAVLAQGLGT